MEQEFKRHVAFKMRIGDVLQGKPILDADKFRFLELNGKHIARVNIIANIIDKYIQDDEKKFGSITLDDASGQIKLKVFGEDIEKFTNFEQGDTVMAIGLLRQWNNEVYILPEIIKKKQSEFLMIRKLETDLEKPKIMDSAKLLELKDKLLEMIKSKESEGGAEIEEIIMELKSSPETINQEIKSLLEDGAIYEPRPGKLRYLG